MHSIPRPTGRFDIWRQVTCGTFSAVFGVNAVTLNFLLCLIWSRHQVFSMFVYKRKNTNSKIISYDCESPIHFLNYWYCTFLVQSIRCLCNFSSFSTEMCHFLLIQSGLFNFIFTCFVFILSWKHTVLACTLIKNWTFLVCSEPSGEFKAWNGVVCCSVSLKR